MVSTSHIAQQLPILLLISFDGFRHDYVDPDIAPNLFKFSKEASIGHMESLYITKTFPNHFSMATGLYEDEHEIINNQMFDPHLNATFKPGNHQREWWDPHGHRIPIWTANELFGEMANGGVKRYSGSMMYPGSMVPFLGMLPTHLQNYDRVRNWTQNVDTVIKWITDAERPASFVSIYFDEPDSTAHRHGPWGRETMNSVKQVDKAAGYLVDRLVDLNLMNMTNLIFVSDHGMAEVKNVTYLEDFIDTSEFDLFGASPDWSVFVKPERIHLKNKIFSELTKISKMAHFRIFRRENIPKARHYSKSERGGDFFILVDEHHDLFKTRSSEYKELPKTWGNHGWDPKIDDMRPLFLAIGPSFKKNYLHHEAFPNVDLFPLMTSLLRLPLELLPNNGSLARVVDMIRVQA